jgi:UDP-glucose 4-epimerase
VGESVENPKKYYVNNVVGGLNLLSAMLEAGVKDLIFSSTCAVYGEPAEVPISEAHPRGPVNPYGVTKYIFEMAMEDYAAAHGLRYVSLRYFNAAGADPEGELGERHDPETHLIPLVLMAAGGVRDEITVFGEDYDTPDGTCIRDYIHIFDLISAHILAYRHLKGGGKSAAFNLGSEKGYSVKEVIDVCREVTGREIKVTMGDRRPGDPPVLVASSEKIKKELGWGVEFNDLAEVVRTAWDFMVKRGMVR